jgi:DNA-binding IclR family transcriptional regulator
MTVRKKPYDYVSVQKALQILLAFEPLNEEMGTMEISARLGIHKSTVSRLLNVLTCYDFLQHDAKTKKFTLGMSAAKIGSAIRRSLSERMVSVAQPYIDKLRNTIGETVALEIWAGKDTVLAYHAESFQRHRAFRLKLGDHVDVHISAGARVIMAFLPPQIVEGVLQGAKFNRYTTNTIVDAEQLKAQLPGIRKQGLARSISERHYDAEVISVPIFNHEKKPVAALGFFTSTERMAPLLESGPLDKLKQTAAEISAKLLFCEEDDLDG